MGRDSSSGSRRRMRSSVVTSHMNLGCLEKENQAVASSAKKEKSRGRENRMREGGVEGSAARADKAGETAKKQEFS